MSLSSKILILALFITDCLALDIIDGAKKEEGLKSASVAKVIGKVFSQCSKRDKRSLLAGDSIGDRCFIISEKSSYMKGLLWDNSFFHLGENSAIEIIRQNDDLAVIKLHQGQFRILNFKKSKEVKSKMGSVTIAKGEFIWSLASETQQDSKFIVLDGYALVNKKRLGPDSSSAKRNSLAENKNIERPWKNYFLGESNSSAALYKPQFNERSIASVVEMGEVSEFEEFLDEEGAVDDQEESFPIVKNKIWVHDIIYDSVMKAVEKAAFKKADEIIPVAIKTACKELVWEVANRSVIKWATKYAYVAGAKEIPRSVASSLNEVNIEDADLYDRELYKTSAQEVATIRSYRRAKSAAEAGGYAKGWREAQKYALALIPEVVLPVVRSVIYDQAKKAGSLAAAQTLETTKLLRTDDVEQLVEHLSQVASTKIAMERINKYSAYYTEMAAKEAALEVAKATSGEIADFVASKASETAGKIMQKKIAQKRAKSVARSIASRNKVNEAQKAQTHSSRTLRETSR